MLPTLEQCLKICNNNEVFKYKVEEIEGKKVFQFTYSLATAKDFFNPLNEPEDKISLTAEELRGLTFVEQADGSFKRYLMLHKFFNLNQTEYTTFNKVKNEKIISVSDKLDGSMITFIPINGKVFAKSKYSFFSEQASMAQEIYNTDPNIRNFVNNCLDNNYCPIFELISPLNQIVLRYNTTELRLIQLRNNLTGEYKPFSTSSEDFYGIKFAEHLPIEEYTFDYMVKEREIRKGIEGWVVSCENGLMLKIKTEEYLNLHRIMTDIVTKENEVIRLILNEEIDDVLSEIPLDAIELRQFIETITDGIVKHINKLVSTLYNRVKALKSECSNKKDYVEKVKELSEKEYFNIMMKAYNNLDKEYIEKEVIEFVKKRTNKLSNAKDYLKEIGVLTHFVSTDEN